MNNQKSVASSATYRRGAVRDKGLPVPVTRASVSDSAEPQTGFTLVEVVLAIALTALVVGLLIEVFITTSRAGPQVSNLIIAYNLAQERMEEVKNLDLAGVELKEGTGSNPDESFLPALDKVSCDLYPTNLYLTESDYYQAQYGTAGSFEGMVSPRRIDRITRIEWIDDPTGGTAQDYKKITVYLFWSEGGKTTSVSLSSYVYQ